MKWKNVLIGLIAATFFSLLLILGAFTQADEKVYDIFLGFRADRKQSSDIVFLDVDDNAIAHNGVFPWPRSVTADSLLRLKEYGARAAIFDIEFIDKGPPGVDTVYLDQGLPADFTRSFSDIDLAVRETISAFKSRSQGSSNIDDYTPFLLDFILDERDSLFARAQAVARDNDQYLIQASALFGRSWSTLNLRPDYLSGEQAERRIIAEERYAYPVEASPRANTGVFIDVLPALPGFAIAAQGAGFTNVEVDGDGIRRRINLAQRVFNHWYLQLAFAPLVNYLGNPEIHLDNRSMVLKQAELPQGGIRDITIPLDGKGRIMLDWPKENYFSSYSHISFLEFSLLEEIETEIEKYARAYVNINIPYFAQFDPSLSKITFISGDLEDLFEAAALEKASALENCSDESFSAYLDYSRNARGLIRELLELDIEEKLEALLPELSARFPTDADAIQDLGEYIIALTVSLRECIEDYQEISKRISSAVEDKFCILGRVDTGTTDIGANPFHGEYVNVGTHGVVLDMILSNSFIRYSDKLWQALFAIIFIPLFLFVSSMLAPVKRITASLVTAILLMGVSILLFRLAGFFISPLITVLALISSAIFREICFYADSEREKQFIRKAFSTYLADDVVKEIIADPSRLQLGGTKRHMSAIFSDIQLFSTISEQLDPENLVSLLNRYLTVMSNAVLAEKGTIDKYEGDAIVAFFGAPIPLPDHALRACVSAITMKRIESDLNKKIAEDRLSPSPLITRIGINTGSMVAGNMGTEQKMNYTIMGNAVNLAARLEGVNKLYGTWILATENTLEETEGRILARRLDRVRVFGINEPVRIYNLINIMEDADSNEKQLVTTFHGALDFFENREWKKALDAFKESLGLETNNPNPSALFIERCKSFIINPPKDNWDGIISLTEK